MTKPKPRVNLDWDFLEALNLGERYEVDISPTRQEIVARTRPSLRTSYKRAQSAVFHINQRTSRRNFKLTIRMGDFRDKKQYDKAYIYCIQDGDKTFSPPPPGGFAGAVFADKRKKAAAAALPAQLEAENAKQEEARHTPKPAPHIRQVTKDDTLRLVKLVEAHTQGEIIQELRGTNWVDAPKPNWTLPVAQLRLKPAAQREAWVLFERGFIGNFTRITAVYDTPDAIPNIDRDCLVHYREVLPEEESE